MRVGVLGTGLMGASIGLAAKEAGVASRVVGWDPDEDALASSLEQGALDEVAESPESLARQVDLLVAAAPTAQLPLLLTQVLAAAKNTTVTDIGSTKTSVCAAAGTLPHFVGGHPLAGSENGSATRARADLFDGATWFLTPVPATDPSRYGLVHGFVSALGATPVAIDPQAHDRLVAVASHLPHMLASLLVNQIGTARIDGHDPLLTAGGSLRDLARIAGADPGVWTDVVLDNAPAIHEALGEHCRRVVQLQAALAAGDAGLLTRWVAEAEQGRKRILEAKYRNGGPENTLRVEVRNRPGVLAGITQALGAAHVNIEHFDLEQGTQGRPGILSLAVRGDSEAARAAEILDTQGYDVSVIPAAG